uniref:5'-AMP-activated protein kinase subunit gamma-2 n=1 Tax=Meloidogyne hapla TaxID=6305 RepID=A0A1I8BSJ3_MELHA
MFGNNSSGKGKGSIRKAIYKQLARPNTSANENTTTSISTDRDCQVPKPRPPSFTFSSPSGTNVAAANNLSMVGTLAVSSPAAIASDGNLILASKLHSFVVTPFLENTSGVLCNIDRAIPPSSSAPEATEGQQNWLLQPKHLSNGQQMTRVSCHQQHYRSISDSPKYVNTGKAALLATYSPAPLLIPLGNSQFFLLSLSFIFPISMRYYKNDQMEDGVKLEEHKISTWRDIFKSDSSLRPFITVDPAESLYRAVQLLCEHKIHRLPVMEHATGNILYILTHKRLIKFLHLYISDLPKPAFMDKTPKELGIGSWENICTISKSTPLIEAMKTFLSKRVSALPLIDTDGKVVDIYAKFDVINLAADKTYDKLDVTVYEALKQRSEWFEGVRKCSDKDSLNRVIDILVKAEVHRLVAVDDENRAVGIISLSDVLRHLILELPSSKDIEQQIANAIGARETPDMGILDLEASIEDVHVAQRV